MVDATLLNRGQVTGQNIANGGIYTMDIDCQAGDTLVVEVAMLGAADADLAVTLRPVGQAGAVYPIAITEMQKSGPTHNAGTVYFQGRYDISVQDKVRIEVKNNNAAAKTANINWRQN